MKKAEAPLSPQAARLAAPSQIANRKSKIPWLLPLALVVVTLVLYWPATRCGFVNYDDDLYVTSNVHVQNGLTWESMRWACLNPVAANWHPLTVWSHMADCQLFGLKPWGHHLTNVVLHALNSGLVFVLLQLLTGARWRSLLVGALFAVHPLHVESVAWVSERKDVLSGFFGLFALLAYARYAQGRMQNAECRTQEPATRDTQHATRNTFHVSLLYLLSLFFFALGLMSKPMLVTWPFVMLLLDYWPLGRMQNAECRMENAAPPNTLDARRSTLLRLVTEKLPFFFLAVAVSIVTFLVQQRGGAVMQADSLPLGARVANAMISYGRYLEKLFCPADLAVYYPRPVQWPLGKVLLAGGLILGLSVLVWMRRRRYPYLLVGWLWFLGTLVPVIGLVQVGGQAMADRYTYLPSLGLLLLAVWGAHQSTRSCRYQALALSVAGAAAIVLCLGFTRRQIGYWKASETLFRHALEVTENNYLAHDNLGTALAEEGQTDEAITQYRESIRVKPNDSLARNNLGTALLHKGQVDGAISQYQEAIRLQPGYADAHNNLGNAFLQEAQVDEAISQYQEAIRLQPAYADAHNNLGLALGKRGRTEEAIGEYQKALRIDPNNGEAHFRLGNALAKNGKIDLVIPQLQEAARLKPDNATARNNLGNALARKGQLDEAISQFREALRLKPDEADAYYNLGNALARRGQLEEAISQYRKAIALKPDDADAHSNLGVSLYRTGRSEEAIGQFQEALRLKPDYAEARKNLDVALAKKAHSSAPPGPSTKP
jgi:tetratricopeptide (TPR) repeat protein